MVHEPEGGDQHPVAPDDIKGIFRGLVGGDAAADTGILCKDIIDLPTDGQAVPEEVFGEIGIPQQGGVVLVKMADLLPPVVVEAGIDLKARDGEDRERGIVVLGPEMRSGILVDAAAGIGIIEVGIYLDHELLRDIFNNG